MLSRFFAVAALAALPVTANAEPMWEISEVWTCETASHFKITVDGEDLRVNEAGNRKLIDFTDGFVSTGFGDTQGWITGKRYYESNNGGFNLLETEYNGEPYPQMIIEKNDEFSSTVASGHADSDRELWVANYRCRPGN
jgi:hypothetical protein